MGSSRPSISIIIIGDEILKGKTKDTNSHFLCRELYECGVHVSKISVVPDDVDVIAAEVAKQSALNTYVITTGGVGPTHDDVTFKAVGKAFNEELFRHKELCRSYDISSKMVFAPKSSKVHLTSCPYGPIVSTRNVYMFPGIPSYLEFMFRQMKHVFCDASVLFATRDLYFSIGEELIVDDMTEASIEFKDLVSFGSYPYVDNRWYRMKLSMESDSEKAIVDAEAFIRSRLPQNVVVGEHPPTSDESLKRLMEVCQEKNKKFMNFVKESIGILRECFKKFSVDSVCLSFNGGKDCTALLHLAVLTLKNMYVTAPKLKALYVASDNSFPESDEFIKLCVERYNLELLSYKQPIRSALSELKSDHPEIKAILMGSRRTDPSCSILKTFQMTDEGWPSFMRVCPLAEWSYPDVWKFLISLDVPYCSLYDKGYTSLGCQHNTLPNEKLLATTKDGTQYYLPAYLLKEPHQERTGRA